MAPSDEDGAPKEEELDAVIEDCDSMLYIVARVEEDTLSLIPEDEACAIEEEITRRIHQEDSSYTDLLKKVKSSAGEAAAELETEDGARQGKHANMLLPPPRLPMETIPTQSTKGYIPNHPLITKDDISLQYQKNMTKLKILDKILGRLKDFEGKEDVDGSLNSEEKEETVKSEPRPKKNSAGTSPLNILHDKKRETSEDRVVPVAEPKATKSEKEHDKPEKASESAPKTTSLKLTFKTVRPVFRNPEHSQSNNTTPHTLREPGLLLPDKRKDSATVTTEELKIKEEKPAVRSEKPIVRSEKPVVRSEKPAVRSEKLALTSKTSTEAVKDDSVDLAFAGHKRQRKPNGQYFNDSFDVKGKGTDLLNNRNGGTPKDLQKQEKRRPGRPKKEKSLDGQGTESGHQILSQLVDTVETVHSKSKPQAPNVEQSNAVAGRANTTESRSGRQRKANSRYANEETIAAITGLKPPKDGSKSPEPEASPKGSEPSPRGVKRGNSSVLQSDRKRMKLQVESPVAQPRRKIQSQWTHKEDVRLLQGIESSGYKWTEIAKSRFPDSLRTPVHLKDRWRNLLKSSQNWSKHSEKEEISEDIHKRVKAVLRSMNRAAKPKR